jgi:uncharacterized protein (TIGR03437 family)
MKFRSDVAGNITGVRFYKGSSNTGTHVGHLWTSSGSLLGTVTFRNETSSGWQQADFSSPIAINANTVYVVSYYAPVGRYSSNSNYFSSGVDNGSLHALANSASANGVYRYGNGFPNSTYQATNYWVDVAFTPTTAPAAAPVISNVEAAPSNTTATITWTTNIASSSAVNYGTSSSALSLSASNTTMTTSHSVTLTGLAPGTQYYYMVNSSTSTTTSLTAAATAEGGGAVSSFTTTKCPCTIFSSTAVPSTTSDSDPNEVELGMKFRSDLDGTISGVRFYKGSGNTGTHVGHLWNSSGSLLGSVTFSSESSSGWQQANFSTPISISANTTYVISYYAPQGHYAADSNFFASSGVDNTPLHALANGSSANGVYVYGGGFPTDSYRASNYWVDVVFNPAGGSSSTTMTTSAAPSQSGRFSVQSAGAAAVKSGSGLTLSCAPRTVRAGLPVICEVRTSSPAAADAAALQVSSSSESLRVPATVVARTGQSSLTFEADTLAAAAQQSITISVQSVDEAAQDTVLVLPAAEPVIAISGKPYTKFDSPLHLSVSATDASGTPVRLTVSKLASGASFDANAGTLDWTPTQAQQGSYEITFTAANSLGVASQKKVTVEVDSGKPVLTTRAADLACSAGAIARLEGRWLSEQTSTQSDPSGDSTDLGGTRVKINGAYVPVLAAAETQVSFLCPNLAASAAIELSVESGSASSAPLSATMRDVTPTLLSWDGSSDGPGLILISGTANLALVRNYRVQSQPAQPNDEILIQATGLGQSITPASLQVKVGDQSLTIDSVQPLSGAAGIYQIQTRIPAGVAFGNALPVQLDLIRPDGSRISSNIVNMSVEPVLP